MPAVASADVTVICPIGESVRRSASNGSDRFWDACIEALPPCMRTSIGLHPQVIKIAL